jgi:putative NIF3 family GTP cyclohydrolase 1 type 2
MHTNFDRAANGVNRTLARIFELDSIEEMPIGIIGEFHLSLKEIPHRLNHSVTIHGSPRKIKK